jgi:hypothetical protein
MLAWNGFAPLPHETPPLAAWQVHCATWRDDLAAQTDLTTQLLGLVTKMH